MNNTRGPYAHDVDGPQDRGPYAHAIPTLSLQQVGTSGTVSLTFAGLAPLVIAWGDAEPDDPQSENTGTLPHIYSAPGTYQILLRDTVGNTATATVTVS